MPQTSTPIPSSQQLPGIVANSVGSPMLFATISGAGNWLDGIRVDACGNVFVPNFSTSALYRITPDGVVSTYYDWPDITGYGHGLEWGNGVGGWDDRILYQPQPYNGCTVVALDIGVPYRE